MVQGALGSPNPYNYTSKARRRLSMLSTIGFHISDTNVKRSHISVYSYIRSWLYTNFVLNLPLLHPLLRKYQWIEVFPNTRESTTRGTEKQ